VVFESINSTGDRLLSRGIGGIKNEIHNFLNTSLELWSNMETWRMKLKFKDIVSSSKQDKLRPMP
jgi:hypothetical protein